MAENEAIGLKNEDIQPEINETQIVKDQKNAFGREWANSRLVFQRPDTEKDKRKNIINFFKNFLEGKVNGR